MRKLRIQIGVPQQQVRERPNPENARITMTTNHEPCSRSLMGTSSHCLSLDPHSNPMWYVLLQCPILLTGRLRLMTVSRFPKVARLGLNPRPRDTSTCVLNFCIVPGLQESHWNPGVQGGALPHPVPRHLAYSWCLIKIGVWVPC